MIPKRVLLALVFLTISFSVFADELKSDIKFSLAPVANSYNYSYTSEISPFLKLSDDAKPEPYGDNEFPAWSYKLRRFEVILFGSFPITYMLTSLVYDLVLMASVGFNSLDTPDLNSDQVTWNKLIISGSLSLVIAIIDIIIDLAKDYNANKAEEEANSDSLENSDDEDSTNSDDQINPEDEEIAS